MLSLAVGKPRDAQPRALRARPGRVQGASRVRWVCSPGPAQNVTSFRRLAVVSEMRGRNVLWQSFTRCHASFLPPLAADGVSRVRGGGSAPRRSGPQRLPEPVPDGSRLQSSADSLSPQTDAVTACGSGEPRRALGPGPIPPRGPSPTARAVVPGVVTCSNVPNGDNHNPGPPTANASFRKST